MLLILEESRKTGFNWLWVMTMNLVAETIQPSRKFWIYFWTGKKFLSDSLRELGNNNKFCRMDSSEESSSILHFPVNDNGNSAKSPTKLPRRLRQRLLKSKSSTPTAQDIETKLNEAQVRRQVDVYACISWICVGLPCFRAIF